MSTPRCPACLAHRPENNDSMICVPCANRGHLYRLITSTEDAAQRVALWTRFYDEHGYTKKERKAIPYFQNLLKMAKD